MMDQAASRCRGNPGKGGSVRSVASQWAGARWLRKGRIACGGRIREKRSAAEGGRAAAARGAYRCGGRLHRGRSAAPVGTARGCLRSRAPARCGRSTASIRAAWIGTCAAACPASPSSPRGLCPSGSTGEEAVRRPSAAVLGRAACSRPCAAVAVPGGRPPCRLGSSLREGRVSCGDLSHTWIGRRSPAVLVDFCQSSGNASRICSSNARQIKTLRSVLEA